MQSLKINRCTVVIPTKNAMPRFQDVLSAVRRQVTPFAYEILVIDSGSKDGTVDYVRQLDDVRLIEIPPTSFGHGKTRNLGIQQANSEYVAFLTHDAEPQDETWLANLVATLEQNDDIAGAFGRHIAHRDASPFTKHDLDTHFAGFLQHPSVVDRHLDPKRYEEDEGWRQFLHFYSDNNSILRKSVWEKIPYPDVEFAEDQLWARSIIEAGYAKAYAAEAVVLHSHDYKSIEQLRRAFDESRNFKKYFGYQLSPKLRQTLRSIVIFSVQAFRQRIDEEKYGRITMKSRFERAGHRAAMVMGHFLGSHYERLPRAIASRLSLDNRLFHS